MNLTPAQSLLLSSFLLPKKIDDFDILNEEDWRLILNDNPTISSESLISARLIEACPNDININKKYTKKELEEILLNKNIKPQKTKEEIIKQILNLENDEIAEILKDFRLFQISEKGIETLNNYKHSAGHSKIDDFKNIDSIKKGKFYKYISWLSTAAFAGIIGNSSYEGLLKIDDLFYGPEKKDHNSPSYDFQNFPNKYYFLHSNHISSFIRTAFNQYLFFTSSPHIARAAIGDTFTEGLYKYREYLKSKFIVLGIITNSFGGRIVQLIFQQKPDKIFSCWIYETNNDYPGLEIRGFWNEEEETKKLPYYKKNFSEYISKFFISADDIKTTIKKNFSDYINNGTINM